MAAFTFNLIFSYFVNCSIFFWVISIW